MSFTYDHSAKPTTAKIRLLVGDTKEAAGPRPDSSNFSDEEIDIFLDMEGDHAMRAAAAILETLAAEWGAYSGQLRTGPVDEQFQQAAAFTARAEAMRSAWGWPEEQSSQNPGFSVTTKR